MSGDSHNTLSEEEFDRWIQPSAAVKLLEGPLEGAHFTALYEQLAAGLIKAHAETIMADRGRESPTFPARAEIPLYVIREEPWAWSSRVWKTNQTIIEVEGYGRSPSTTYHLFNIRLDPSAVKKLLPVEPVDGTEKIPAYREGELNAYPLPSGKHPGGAPPKDIWEAVWIDIAARLINGDFDPKKQADIVNAMLDWASANNADISNATAKRHAKLLWDRVKIGS